MSLHNNRWYSVTCFPANSIRRRNDRTLPLKLQPTYLRQGFFNVIVDCDRYVRSSDGPIPLRLGRNGFENEAKINRGVNQNGTARVLGGVALRNWFQKNFEPMDIVEVDLSSQAVIVLDKQ